MSIFESDRYGITVTEGGKTRTLPCSVTLFGDGHGQHRLPEEIAREYDGLANGTSTLKEYFAGCAVNGEAEFIVRMPEGTDFVTVKPADKSDSVVWDGETATVAFHGAGHLILQPNGDWRGALVLYADLRKTAEAAGKGYRNLIRFDAGIHTPENDPRLQRNEKGAPVMSEIPDDTLIYLDEGAVVNASLILKGVRHVKIAGHGEISTLDRCHGAGDGFASEPCHGGFRYGVVPNVYVRSGCRDVIVEDVVINSEFRSIVIRNSDGVVVRGVKAFTSAVNADGINCYNTRKLLVEDCLIRSQDDCFCMYNSCDSIPFLHDDGFDDVIPLCSDVEVRNCVLSSNCRPIVLGGHATGATDPRCVIENVYIHDCDVVETAYALFSENEKSRRRWSGFLRILSQSEQIVRGLTFENVRVDVTRGHRGQPVHIEARAGTEASYTENRGYRIEDVTFRDIRVTGCTEELLPCYIHCRPSEGPDDGCGISNVTFERFTVGGKGITAGDIEVDGPVDGVVILS